MSRMQRILHQPFFIRLLHWEFWPFHFVYVWVYPIWLWLCLRARSFFFFNAANPGIENGGFLMESKMRIYDLLPHEFYPKTVLIRRDDSDDEIFMKIKSQGLCFPLIAKPDIGGRGRGVRRIEIESELIPYLRKFPFDMLVQELVHFENEIGIFYYRYPGQNTGRISGIVGKKFVMVEGDGESSIEILLQKDKRHILQIPSIRELLPNHLEKILPKGVKKILVPYGNHARGSLFLDYSNKIDTLLEKKVDEICKRIPGFYYGRLDIRFESWEDLKKGKNFSIIEVNGSGSEPTHMYDPAHSIFFAWKEIVRHWRIMWKISKMNHQIGVAYLTTKEGRKMFRDNRKYESLLDSIK